MTLRIVRNDITKMNTEAIVNTANDHPAVGTGCDHAVYQAAGYDQLLAYRKEKIGFVPEGEAFLTPGFGLEAKYIIHAVSPFYEGGQEGEEEKLRSCYKKSLQLAKDHGVASIAFPLISTGGFGYPKEEGMRIAVDEINDFLLDQDMDVYLVVFDEKAKDMGRRIYPDLEEYIDQNYVEEARLEEYSMAYGAIPSVSKRWSERRKNRAKSQILNERMDSFVSLDEDAPKFYESTVEEPRPQALYRKASLAEAADIEDEEYTRNIEELQDRIRIRVEHASDTFSEYLLYLIQKKNMGNAEVYKRAIVDKKVFSKIKNNKAYQPKKLTALCLCVGAKLNLDETKDLLARAGYALSPCDITDIIFAYFIENEIYDMIELDIQLEEHGQPCIIS